MGGVFFGPMISDESLMPDGSLNKGLHIRFLSLSFGFSLLLLGPLSVSAATRTWDGEGSDQYWSTCANWSSDICPTTADTVTFDSTSTEDAFLNASASGTYAIMNMNAGYTGKISLGRSLTLTSTFTQAAGTIELLGQTFTPQAGVTISGGTFTAGTGTVVLSGGAATIDINSTLSLYNLTLSGTTATTKTIGNSDTITVTGTLTLTDGLVSQTTTPTAGTIRAQGDIVQASTFDGGTATVAIDGTSSQAFTSFATVTAGTLPRIDINKSSGTLTLSGTLRTTSNWTYHAGTIDAATNNVTVIFAATLTLSGSHTLQNVRFDGNSTALTITMPSTTTLTASGNLTLDQTGNAGAITLNTGTIAVKGNISIPDALTHGGTATLLVNGTGNQTWTSGASSSAGGLPNVSINKAGGTLTFSGYMRTARNWTYTAGTIDATTNDTTLEFFSTAIPRISGSHTLDNVIFNLSSGSLNRRLVVASGTTLTVAGTLTLTEGKIDGGTVEALGDVSYAGTFDGGSGTLLISGNATRTVTLTGGSIPGLQLTAPNVTLVGPSVGQLTIGNNFVQSAGTFQGGAGGIDIVGSFSQTGGSFTAPSGHLSIGGDFSYAAGTFAHGNGTIIMSSGQNRTFAPPSSLNNLKFLPSLVAYWKFDDTSSALSTDSAGFEMAGAFLSGAATSTSTMPTVSFTNDRSLALDGTDDYVEHGNRTLLNYVYSGPSTTSLWIRTSSVATTLRVLGKGEYSGSETSLVDMSIASGSGYYGTFSRNYPSGLMSTSQGDLRSDTWRHIVTQRTGTGARRYFVDGVLTASNTETNTFPTHNIRNFRIGHDGSSFGFGTQHFAGYIDDVRIYRRAISSVEIAALAAGTEAPSSGITYTLSNALTVAGTLTINGTTLDAASKTVAYGTLASTNGSILNAATSTNASTDSTASNTPVTIPRGGHRGSPLGMQEKIHEAQASLLARYEGRLNESATEEVPDPSRTVWFPDGSIHESPIPISQSPVLREKRGRLSVTRGKSEVLYRDVVTQSWYAPYVSYMITEGIAEGYRDAQGELLGEFGVDNPITRAEVLRMALEAAELTTDLPQLAPKNSSARASWAASYVRRAEDMNLSVFRSNPDVNAPATRGEVIQILLETFSFPIGKTPSTFSDVPKDHRHTGAIGVAAYYGLIEGDRNAEGVLLNQFRPDEAMNRAEVAKIIALAEKTLKGQ